MTRRCWIIVLLLLLAPLLHAAVAGSTVKAFLDRDQVSLGDTVTLNLSANGNLGAPDLTPLARDFAVLGTSQSSSTETINGKTTTTNQLGIALRPLHAGTLTIPSLLVGSARTQALTLKVAAAPSGGGKVGDPVFIEVHASDAAPYVDQQIVYTARLFYLPGVDGAWGDPQANGARVVKLDRDQRYSVDRDGYTYLVLERSWAVIPQRAGAISITGPAFQGSRIGNLGSMLGGNFGQGGLPSMLPAQVGVTAPRVEVTARAIPANGGKPWLPARDVQLQLSGWPAGGKVAAGVPFTLTLAITADGQPADALPEPSLPVIAGAEVYPDNTQDATDDSGPWLRGRRTRSFAIVPRNAGSLALPAITLAWWNTTTDRPAQASVPAHAVTVRGNVAVATRAAPTSVTPVASTVAAHVASGAPASTNASGWRALALASVAAWGVAIFAVCLWWLRRRRGSLAAASHATTPRHAEVAADVRALHAAFIAATHASDAAGCERALLAWARAERRDITSVGSLADALDDPAQRAAIVLLQRVRWHGGDAAAACAVVGAAFSDRIAWRVETDDRRGSTLPPLYPAPASGDARARVSR